MINVSSISKGGGLKALPSFTETISGNTGSFQSVLASLNEEKGRYDTESSRIGSERASSPVSNSNAGKKFHRNAGASEYRGFSKRYINKSVPEKNGTVSDEPENKKIKGDENTGAEYIFMSGIAPDKNITDILPIDIAEENDIADLFVNTDIAENDENLANNNVSGGITGFTMLQGSDISVSNDDTAETGISADNKFEAVFNKLSEALNLTDNDKAELNKILNAVPEISDNTMAKLTDKLSVLAEAVSGGNDFIEKSAAAILSDIADTPDLENSAAAIENLAGGLSIPERKEHGEIKPDGAEVSDKAGNQAVLSEKDTDMKHAYLNSENVNMPAPEVKTPETDTFKPIMSERTEENNSFILNAAEKQAADKLINAFISFLNNAEALKVSNEGAVFTQSLSDMMKAADIDDTAAEVMPDIKYSGMDNANVSGKESRSSSSAFTFSDADIGDLQEQTFINKPVEENTANNADKADTKVSLRPETEKAAGDESELSSEKNSARIEEKNAVNAGYALKKDFKTVNVEVTESLRGESAAKSELQSKTVSLGDMNKSLSDNAKSDNAALFPENESGENISSDKGENFNYFLKSSAEAQSAKNADIRSQEAAKAYNMRESRDIERLVRNIQSSVSKGESKLTVTLTPENLGKLQIQLTEQGGKITAKFLADNESSHKIIMAQSDLLKNQLSEKGIVVDNMEFAFNDAMTKQGTGSEDNGKRSAKAGKGKNIKNDSNDLSVGTDVANNKSNGIYA